MQPESAALRLASAARRILPDRWVLAVYTRPRLAGFLRSTLNLFAPSGLHTIEVAGGALRGLSMELNLKREKYLWLGTYEPWVQEAIACHLRPGDWAWDVGAFIGYHTLLMWRLGARVVAIEPDPENFERLLRNVAANGAHDVWALKVAVGSHAGRANLQRLKDHPSQTRVVADGGGECALTSLDSLLAEFPAPRLVKVDVEGAELDVLAGATRLLAEFKPVCIVEVHGAAEQVGAYLRRCGYMVVRAGKGAEVDSQPPVGAPAHIVAIPQTGVGNE